MTESVPLEDFAAGAFFPEVLGMSVEIFSIEGLEFLAQSDNWVFFVVETRIYFCIPITGR